MSEDTKYKLEQRTLSLKEEAQGILVTLQKIINTLRATTEKGKR